MPSPLQFREGSSGLVECFALIFGRFVRRVEHRGLVVQLVLARHADEVFPEGAAEIITERALRWGTRHGVGQDVVIKLSAYEYTVYGGLKGVVTSISPDALGDPDRASAPEGTWYRAVVKADAAALKHGDKLLQVMPGMTGSVEIRTGQRSVLGFLFQPLLKSAEAFRER